MDGRGPGGGDQRVVRLLTALVALVAVLVAAITAGGAVAWREYARLRAAVERVAGDEGSPGRRLAGEVARRQEEASQQLAEVAGDASRQIARFEARAEKLREQGGGPVASAARAVELTQLMSDQMLLQLKLMNALTGTLEKAARPLAAERALFGAPGAAEPPHPARQARTPRQDR